MSNKTMSKTKIALIGAAVVLTLLVSSAAAAYFLRNPESEDVTDTPLDPTPTPTPTASPSPSPTATVTELHMSSNLTVGSFYKGDTLCITATYTPATSGVTITLHNIGLAGDTIITTAVTNTEGKATFDRTPINPFHYYVTVE